jgi:hypothetical protein
LGVEDKLYRGRWVHSFDGLRGFVLYKEGRRKMRRLFVGLGAALVLGLATAVATGAIPDGDGNFYACVNSAGNVRLIEKSESCRKSERRVSWPAGQAELKLYSSHSSAVTNQPSTLVRAYANCDEGDPVTGGGFNLDSAAPPNAGDVTVLGSEPGNFSGPNIEGWRATASITSSSVSLYATARCLDLPPAHN